MRSICTSFACRYVTTKLLLLAYLLTWCPLLKFSFLGPEIFIFLRFIVLDKPMFVVREIKKRVVGSKDTIEDEDDDDEIDDDDDDDGKYAKRINDADMKDSATVRMVRDVAMQKRLKKVVHHDGEKLFNLMLHYYYVISGKNPGLWVNINVLLGASELVLSPEYLRYLFLLADHNVNSAFLPGLDEISYMSVPQCLNLEQVN